MAKKLEKILVVEDDPILSKVLGTVLRGEGITVNCLSDGAEALNEILHHPYSLVLLDVLLPGMDGLDVLARLGEEKNKTPVLIFSNMSRDEKKEDAKRLGAKGYYVKSDLSIKEIVKLVKKFL